ncbi:unnamed protein product, partial [Symbiodinium sp. KB8]
MSYMLGILAGAIRSDVQVEPLDARNSGSQSTTAAANDYSDVRQQAAAGPAWDADEEHKDEVCRRPDGWCQDTRLRFSRADCDADGTDDLVCEDDTDGRWILHSRSCEDQTYNDGHAPPCTEMRGLFQALVADVEKLGKKDRFKTKCSF